MDPFIDSTPIYRVN